MGSTRKPSAATGAVERVTHQGVHVALLLLGVLWVLRQRKICLLRRFVESSGLWVVS